MKRTFIINGQTFKTSCGAQAARKAYNRKNTNDQLKSACDAWQFTEVR